MNFATTLDVYQGTAACGSFYYDLENFWMFGRNSIFSFFVLIYLNLIGTVLCFKNCLIKSIGDFNILLRWNFFEWKIVIIERMDFKHMFLYMVTFFACYIFCWCE